MRRHGNSLPDPRLRKPLGEVGLHAAADVAEYREEVIRGDDGVTLLIYVDGDPVGLTFLFREDERRDTLRYGLLEREWRAGQGDAG